jgi:uncharacterized OsmC-like protein
VSSISFKVTASSENPTKTVVRARNFEMIIDEPKNLKGTDEGPNPVEYVLAALAGCLNVVGHVVAREMGFQLRGITFELEGDLDPAKFMGKPTENRAGYAEIRVKVKPDCDVNKQQLETWLHSVESRCPVSDNISHSTPVKISLG